jgi:osmotically inducible lipoprotein OsmB
MTMWRAIATCLVLVPVGLSLAGCGYNPGDRALSGGLIGAGGGAAIAGITGGNPLVGAAIGGGAGALGGVLTSGHDINLGRPIWR